MSFITLQMLYLSPKGIKMEMQIKSIGMKYKPNRYNENDKGHRN